MCRLPLGLTVLLTCWAISRAEDPKSVANDDFEKVLGELRESARRVDGVQLAITAEIKSDPTHKIDMIHIKWTLDYTGPRPPLVIQKPMYPEHSYEATRIRVMAPGKSRLVPTVHLECIASTPHLRHLYFPVPAKIFVTIDKGKTASGLITVPMGAVKYELFRRWAKEIGDAPPAALYVQLLHFPKQRGEELNLDAWTAGTSTGSGLYSAPVKVNVSKW